jgi:hypothetical protein
MREDRMNRRQYSTLCCALLAAALLISGCGNDSSSSDNQPPSTPRLVAHTSDSDYAQFGIRAEPVANESVYLVRVEWYANPEPDVAGYRIWRVNEFGEPRRHYVVKDLRMNTDLIPGRAVYSYIDQGDSLDGMQANLLTPDSLTGESRGYYWEVQAYDTANNRSDYSARVYYRLISNPYNLSVYHTTGNDYVAVWQYTPKVFSDTPSYFMIRAYSYYYGPDSVVYFTSPPAQLYQTDCSWTMHLTGPLISDCTYVCQINAIVNHPNAAHTDSLAGAAAFTTFTYQH